MLDNVGMIAIQHTLAKGLDGMRWFTLTPYGLDTYLRSHEPRYPAIQATTIARLGGWPEDQGTEQQLADIVDGPQLVVQHVLELCASKDLLKITRVAGPSRVHFWAISPRLRRIARELPSRSAEQSGSTETSPGSHPA